MKRCLAEGRDRFELWVGAAVLANNLVEFAALLDGAVASQSHHPAGLWGIGAHRRPDWPDDLQGIVHIDHYGNAMSLRAAVLPRNAELVTAGRLLQGTFSDRPPGTAFSVREFQRAC